MTDFNVRVSELIKELGIRKTAFADRLNVSQAFVSQMCSGAAKPSDRTISDICREFNVSETWLRTGAGEMFRQRSKLEELSEFFGDVLSDDQSAKSRLIVALSKLTDEQWEILGQVIDALAERHEKKEADPE